MKQCTSRSPVYVTLCVLGGKWKALILWHLLGRVMRFGELAREVRGITQKMLVQQLRELEADGLISRKIYPEVPPRVEYTATDYGLTLTPLLEAMEAWGKQHQIHMQGQTGK